MIKNRRKQVIINKPFQYKIMGYLTFLAIGIVSAFALALVFSKAIITQPETVTVAASATPQLMDILWIPILITLFLAIIATLFMGSYYSHRIAGPLFNLKRVLSQIENGFLDKKMAIRSKDELHDVQDAVNDMLAGLNERVIKVKEACMDLNDKDKRKLLSIINEQFKYKQ